MLLNQEVHNYEMGWVCGTHDVNMKCVQNFDRQPSRQENTLKDKSILVDDTETDIVNIECKVVGIKLVRGGVQWRTSVNTAAKPWSPLIVGRLST
jgi:hypothetical protein